MSACDTCAKPGACCTDMFLSSTYWNGMIYAEYWPGDAVRHLDAAMPGHPFIPLRLEIREPGTPGHNPTANRPYGAARWACTRLTPEGRCGDYENRPNLCKAYEPLSDGLCAMYVPPAAEEPPCA